MKRSEIEITESAIAALPPFARNARIRKKQIKQIARSIERFGRAKVPAITLSHLSEAERRAYVLADSKLALNAGWDKEIERCRKAGLPEPQMIPHPDDIVLNLNNGDVQILGPQTKKQKQRLDHALERRDGALRDKYVG